MKMNKIITLSVITTTLAMSSAYKLPEQSVNSMALGAAYIAHTKGADTTYFNPAGMAFMRDKNFIEASASLIHVFSQEYTLDGVRDGSSEVEDIVVPDFHYVSPKVGDFRFGLSFLIPGGLTRRWETPFQKISAQEFTLKILELNPTMSYKINENFAVGGGVRFIYSEGVVKSDGGTIFPLKREMEGNTIEFGYNLAMLYKAPYEINLAMTYRSNIDLKEKGEANLFLGGVGKQYKDADVTVPLPAGLNIAMSKTFGGYYTIEFVYERTFWSTYKNLDFNYKNPPTNPVLSSAFDDSKARNWKDSDAFRVGLTAGITHELTLMYGFSYDKTPVQNRYIGFELADSDAMVFSGGARYQYSKNFSFGASLLYDIKDDIKLKAGEHDDKSPFNVLNSGGKFDKGGALLGTVGIAYEF